MRASTLALSVLLSFTLYSPVLRAQFIPPTPEELKMTEDPKAPGAAAVYLNMQEIDDDPTHYQSFYARIKILSEKGKELSVVNLPYLNGGTKITDIKGRTIHADGTIIPLEGKPEDLMTAKSGDRKISRKVFTLPKVEVGSIIEYRYDLRYDDNRYSTPEWEIQQKYYIHKAHYSFVPFAAFQPGPKGQVGTSMYLTDYKGRAINSLIWWMKLPDGVTVKTDVGGRYTVDVEDIPAIPDEEFMPPIQSFLYKVFFYYKPSYNAQEFWTSEAKEWVKENDRFAEVSKGLREAVAKIVAPTDSELDKAKKLYDAVEALENTDYTRKKTESEMKALNIKASKHAEDVWKQKSGDSEEIALLYLGMLRAAGLKAYAVKVVARNRGIFDPSYMYMGQLNDTLIDLHIGTEKTLLDPGEKMCPYGTLNWRHSGVRGLAESDSGPSILTTPELSYKETTSARTANLELDNHGGVAGTVQYTMTGQGALRWRQFALRNDMDEIKKSFDHDLETMVPNGVEAHVDHFLGLEDPKVNLIAVVKVQGKLGMATSKRIMLPGMFFEAHGHRPFVDQAKRLVPVDMEYAEQIIDQVNYKLPEGYTVEGAPEASSIAWKGHVVYVVRTQAKPGAFIIARQLARGFSQAKPEEYQDLRGFYQKIAAADQQQLVLAAPSTTSSAPAATAAPSGN